MSGNVVLISTYELGRQPFGLASLAAWLKAEGANVSLQDLAISKLDTQPLVAADLVAFYVPMHTATRLAATIVERVKSVNADAHICFFGLYASLNETYLGTIGADSIIGGEFEQGVVDIYKQLATRAPITVIEPQSSISLRRQQFRVPDRTGLPPLDEYAGLHLAPDDVRVVGYTEASRGCKHMCRHCPIVPVYGGRFVVVQPDIVLEDVRRQVGSGAQHITFGDPDFFNGPAHALRIVQRMHDEFPELTYDVTIKVEHLLRHSHLLPQLKSTGCVLVTSAIESFDDDTLAKFDKQHTRADLESVLAKLKVAGLALNPTFVTFTPWTTLDRYIEFLSTLADLGLVEAMSPVQYAIRLLVSAKSRLLELPDIAGLVAEFDDRGLVYPWKHPDPAVDRLFEDVTQIVQQCQDDGLDRVETFNRIWGAANAARGVEASSLLDYHPTDVRPLAAIPYLTEPWYC